MRAGREYHSCVGGVLGSSVLGGCLCWDRPLVPYAPLLPPVWAQAHYVSNRNLGRGAAPHPALGAYTGLYSAFAPQTLLNLSSYHILATLSKYELPPSGQWLLVSL